MALETQSSRIITFTLRNFFFISSYILDYHQLDRCQQIRDLGVILDMRLTFAQHADEVRKACRMLGLLSMQAEHAEHSEHADCGLHAKGRV